MSLQNQNLQATPSLSGSNIVVIQSNWHREYSDKMFQAFSNQVHEMGIDNKITLHIVPGCWEIPQFLSYILCKSKDEKSNETILKIIMELITKKMKWSMSSLMEIRSFSLSKITSFMMSLKDLNHGWQL